MFIYCIYLHSVHLYIYSLDRVYIVDHSSINVAMMIRDTERTWDLLKYHLFCWRSQTTHHCLFTDLYHFLAFCSVRL